MNFNGKYRAYVVDVNDPENRGRIKVSVPAVTMEYLLGASLVSLMVSLALQTWESVFG